MDPWAKANSRLPAGMPASLQASRDGSRQASSNTSRQAADDSWRRRPYDFEAGSSSSSLSDLDDGVGLDTARSGRPVRPPRPPHRTPHRTPQTAPTPVVAAEAPPLRLEGAEAQPVRAGSSASPSPGNSRPPEPPGPRVGLSSRQPEPPVPETVQPATPKFWALDLVSATGGAIQDMLQMKYGLALDGADFASKVQSHCRSGGDDRAGGTTTRTPSELVTQLNARPDLRFCVRGEGGVEGRLAHAGLRVEVRPIRAFAELHREVCRMPGTSRSVAVIRDSECSLSGPQTPGAGSSLPSDAGSSSGELCHAVSVFREDYARPGFLVGRAGASAQSPLLSFGAEALVAAAVLDPEVTKLVRRPEGPSGQGLTSRAAELPPPDLREEYVSLGAWLLPADTSSTASAGGVASARVAHVSSSPWSREEREAASLPANAAAPTPEWMRGLRRMLEHPDASGEAPAALLGRLAHWLGGSSEEALDARHVLQQTDLYEALVETVRRAGAETRERGDGRIEANVAGPSEAYAAAQACLVIGLAARESREVAEAYGQARAVPTICGLLRQWPAEGEVQWKGLFALVTLIDEDSHICAVDAFEEGAARLASDALAAHPRVAEVQRDAPRIVQLLVARPADSDCASTTSTLDYPDGVVPGRRGIAAALVQRRRAEASTKGGALSAAVTWLLARVPVSQPLDLDSRADQREPAPCLPSRPVHGGQVPRLDLRGVEEVSPRLTSPAAVPLGVLGGFAGRMQPAGRTSSLIRADEDTPFTPNVVRLHRKEGEDAMPRLAS